MSEIAERLSISQRAYSDLENDKTQLDIERLETLAKIFEIEPVDLLTFDENKIFNNVFNDPANGYFADKIISENFESERQSYQSQINHLKEEVAFLRELVRKKT